MNVEQKRRRVKKIEGAQRQRGSKVKRLKIPIVLGFICFISFFSIINVDSGLFSTTYSPQTEREGIFWINTAPMRGITSVAVGDFNLDGVDDAVAALRKAYDNRAELAEKEEEMRAAVER